jgi:hypothetical protein
VIAANLYGMYLINPLSKINVYVKAGINYNMTVGKDPNVYFSTKGTEVYNNNGVITVTETGYSPNAVLIELQKYYPSVLASVGVIQGRQKLEFCYFSHTGIGNPDLYSFSVGAMGLYYYFTMYSTKKGKHL